jgi:hypothetical protein
MQKAASFQKSAFSFRQALSAPPGLLCPANGGDQLRPDNVSSQLFRLFLIADG